MEPSNSISPLSRKGRYDDSPLIRLPLELRSWIYYYAIGKSRCPSPKDVYSNVLCEVWKDMPSPLLAVNRQIRDEVCKILRREGLITLRITGQGMNFDSVGLSTFIACQQCTFTGNIRRLRIEVWAPHPERPVETYYIWKNLRRLRNDLGACKQIRHFVIHFRENDQYPWSQDGVLGNWLSTSKQTVAGSRGSDIHHMLSLFLFLTNTSKTYIGFPASILDREEHDELVMYADGVENNMLEDNVVNDDFDSCRFRRLADCMEEAMLLAECFLKYKTAVLAEKRLNEITQFGRFPMSQADYLDFVKVWPHFETLSYPDFGHSFKGCSFYANIHGQEQADQDNRLQSQPTQGQKLVLDMWLGLKGIDEVDPERTSI